MTQVPPARRPAPRRWARARLGAALLALAGSVSAGVLLASAPPSAAAAAGGLGGLDQSFGNSSVAGLAAIDVAPTTASSIALVDSGGSSANADSIVVAGDDTANGSTAMAVGMVNPTGTQVAWANTALVSGSSHAEAVATTPGGGGLIAVAGQSGSDPALVLLEQSGTLDTAFGPGGTGVQTVVPQLPAGQKFLSGDFSAVAYDAVTGDLYAAGTVQVNDGTAQTSELFVAAFTTTGLDTAFAGTGYSVSPVPGGGILNSQVHALAVDGAGDLVVAGTSQQPDSTSCSSGYSEGFVTALSAALGPSGGSTATGGALSWPVLDDPGASTCGSTTFDAVAVDSGAGGSGDVIAAGYSLPAGAGSSGLEGSGLLAVYSGAGAGLASITTTGGPDSVEAFEGVALLPAPGGGPASIVASGREFQTATEAYYVAVQHYAISGSTLTLDSSFGSGGTELLPCTETERCGSGLAVQASGSIEVGGGLSAIPTGGQASGLAVAQLTDRSVSVVGPSQSISDSSGSVAPAQFEIEVASPNDPTLSTLGSAGLPVAFQTEPGTGKAGTNYTTESGTVVFPCTGAHSEPASVTCVNALQATVSVPTLFPKNAIGSASFSLQLTSAPGASIAAGSASALVVYPAQVVATTVTAVTTTVPSGSGAKSSGGGKPVTTTTVPPKGPVRAADGKGYWIVTATGGVFAYGDARSHGQVSRKALSGKIVSIAATSDGEGYWIVSSTGRVYAFGNAKSYGSVAKKKLRGTIVAFAAGARDRGYWLVSSAGAVYGFGDARGFGSVPAKQRSGSVVAIAPSASGRGYLLVSTTGHVYAFGKARAFGSVAPKTLSGRVVAIALGRAAKGYWLLSSTGRVYSFGDAHYYGSVGVAPATKAKSKPAPKSKSKSATPKKTAKTTTTTKAPKHSGTARAASAARDAGGYWAASSRSTTTTTTPKPKSKSKTKTKKAVKTKSKKTVKTKSKKTTHKKAAQKPQKLSGVAKSIVATKDFRGYWVTTSTGRVYPFGDAKSYGSAASKKVKSVVGAAST